MLQIAIVTNSGPIAYERTQAFEDEMRRTNIQVVKKIMFDESWDANEMIKSGLLIELASSARGKWVLVPGICVLERDEYRPLYSL